MYVEGEQLNGCWVCLIVIGRFWGGIASPSIREECRGRRRSKNVLFQNVPKYSFSALGLKAEQHACSEPIKRDR